MLSGGDFMLFILDNEKFIISLFFFVESSNLI